MSNNNNKKEKPLVITYLTNLNFFFFPVAIQSNSEYIRRTCRTEGTDRISEKAKREG